MGTNLSKYSPVASKNEKLYSSQNYKTSLEIPGSSNMDLNLSTISNKSKRDSNFSYLK